MGFIISNKEFVGGKKKGNLYWEGEGKQQGKYYTLLRGECFGTSEKELSLLIAQHPKGVPPANVGEYLSITYDEEKEDVHIITDRFGRETCYYYHKNKHLIITDNFWNIIKQAQFTYDDVNIQAIKESLMLFTPLNEETFIKNIYTVPAAANLHFNPITGKKQHKIYWSYKLQTKKRKKQKEKFDNLHQAFINITRNIKHNNDRNTIYGVGVSGGLDSRLTAYYAKKENMQLQSFIIGQKRPHIFFRSRDHKNAQQICKQIGIPHAEVAFNSETYETKMKKDIEKYPTGSAELFKYIHKALPKFQVLLTGVGDMYVGSKIPENITKLSKKQLANEVLLKRGVLQPPKSLIQRFLEITKLQKTVAETHQEVPGIISKEDMNTARKRLINFFNNKQDRSNFELYQDYVIAIQGSKNKLGAFESMLGEKQNYSLYNHEVFDEALTWKEEELIDRTLLKAFVKARLPQLAAIKLQNWQPSMGKKFGSNLASASSLFSFIIRGWGVMRYPQWSYTKKFKRFAKKEFEKPSPWFDQIFDKTAVWEAYTKKTIDCRMFLQLLKLRRLLEKIKKRQ